MIRPGVTAADRAAFCALGRGKARWDGALCCSAAPSVVIFSVGTRWSGGTALAGEWSWPNRPFSPRHAKVIIGVPGRAGTPGEALADPLGVGWLRRPVPDACPGWSLPTSGLYRLRLHRDTFVLAPSVCDECTRSPPLRNRPQWKAGVLSCNTIKRFCGDTGWAIPEPDRPILVARVYQGTGCPVELVGTPRSWPILSPLKQKLGPLETFKAEPLWATPQKSSSSSESAVRLRERALMPWPEPLRSV